MTQAFSRSAARRAGAALLSALLLAFPAAAQDDATPEPAPEETPAQAVEQETVPEETGAQEIDVQEPVAIVGPEVITEGELRQAFQSRGVQFGPTLEAAREELLDMVAAEYWVQQFFGARALTDPRIRGAVGEAERQILFELYAQSQFDPTPPTEAEIEAYVAENPQAFGERVEYRFQRFRIALPGEGAAAQVDELLKDIVTGEPTAEEASELARGLSRAGIPFDRSTIWLGSEALAEPVLARLEGLRVAEETVDIEATPEAYDVLILFEARPDPVDPALVRDGIATRILQERYQAERAELAARIAEPLRAAAESGAPVPLGRRFLAALGVLGGALGLVLAGAMTWSGRTRQLFRLARADNSDDGLPGLRRPGPVTAMAALLAVLGLVAAGAALAYRPVVLTSLPGLSVFLGLTVLALILGLLLWRGREATLDQARSRQGVATVRAWVLLAVQVAFCAAFVFLPFVYQ